MFKEFLEPYFITLETFKINYAGLNRPYTLSTYALGSIFTSFVPTVLRSQTTIKPQQHQKSSQTLQRNHSNLTLIQLLKTVRKI